MIYGLLGRVTHVLSIETVVAELVHDDFICREIVRTRTACDYTVNSKKKGGLAQLVPVRSVLEVAYRADSEYYILNGTCLAASADINNFLQGSHAVFNSQSFSCKFVSRSFQTVGDNHALTDMTEAPAGSQGYYDLVAFPEMFSCLLKSFIGISKKPGRVFPCE